MNQSIEATLKQEPSKKVQYLILTTIIVAAFVWSYFIDFSIWEFTK